MWRFITAGPLTRCRPHRHPIEPTCSNLACPLHPSYPFSSSLGSFLSTGSHLFEPFSLVIEPSLLLLLLLLLLRRRATLAPARDTPTPKQQTPYR